MKFDMVVSLIKCVKENGRKLTPKIMAKYNITHNYINNFKEFNILKLVSRGSYIFSNKGMYYYLKQLRRTGKYDEALVGFLEYKEIEKNAWQTVNYQIFKLYVLKEDYENAFLYFKTLINLNSGLSYFNILVLYTFDYLIKLPNEYKDYIIKIKVDSKTELGKIIENCQRNNFEQAFNQLEKKSDKEILELSVPKIELLKKMFCMVYTKRDYIKDEIFEYITNKKYAELYQYLYSMQSIKAYQTTYYETLLSLLRLYFKIKNSEAISYLEFELINDIKKHVASKDYKSLCLSLSLCKLDVQTNKITSFFEDFYNLIRNSKIKVEDYKDTIIDVLEQLKKDDSYVIIDRLNNKEIYLLEMAMKDKEIEITKIKYDGELIIILRKIKYDSRKEYEDNLEKLRSYYRKGNDLEVIKIGTKLLNYPNINPKVLGYLGLVNFKHNLKNNSDKCFLAANLLAKKERINLNYSKFITSSKLMIDKDRLEKEAIFYGIENIYEILEFYFNHKINLEIACLHFGADVYQVNIIKLLIARQYYIVKDYQNGDLYYNSVISSEYQNASTKFLLEEFEEKKTFKNDNLHQAIEITNKLLRKKNS
ncbi:MAG: hypothetical protein IJA94_00545 [Bacilli bacterium]|nr:hypothetical protein [Bacilli bacterium]